jgi:hypothetical protein
MDHRPIAELMVSVVRLGYNQFGTRASSDTTVERR